MAKFLIGVLAGIVLTFVGIGLIFLVVVHFQKKPPSVASNSVLVVRLSGDVPEKPPLSGLFDSGAGSVTMPNVWLALRRAAGDSRISAVMLEPDGLSAGWGRLEELRADIEKLRKSGKPVFAYLRDPGTREYYVALAAGRIYMGPQETLMLKGLRAEALYFKKTLDKLGVQVQIEHAGKYKDFGDMFTRSDMSPETREVMTGLVDDLYGNLVVQIAAARHKSPEEVRAIIDQGPFTASRALAAGLVDELRFEDQAWGELQSSLRSKAPKKISISDYIRATQSEGGGHSRIALLAAAGDIVRGQPSDDGSGESGLTSYGFDKLLNRVANDNGIKGAIVRIDSPGGEVTASDEIWRQMNLLSKKKPLVISMSDTAASGGYYMAMTGDPIVAYPETLTGSIGVVFGKPDLHGLYDKLGVTKDAIQRGRNADITSDYTQLSPEELALLRAGVDENYKDFVSKVAAARHRSFEQIEPVAQGRVWLGSQALPRGLVDQLGGLDAALDLVKKRAGIPAAESVKLEIYPQPESIFDLIVKRSSSEEALEAKLSAVFGRLPFHALMRGGYLRLMPYPIEIR
jgi:protease-4